VGALLAHQAAFIPGLVFSLEGIFFLFFQVQKYLLDVGLNCEQDPQPSLSMAPASKYRSDAALYI
jgi:hypothetical protein